MDTREKAVEAKEASIRLAAIPGDVKNKALAEVARALEQRQADILAANRADMEKAQSENLASPLLKRLKFDEGKIKEVCDGLHSLIGLPDPVGQTLSAVELDKYLELYRVSCPIGVIGIIFESRPDALVQISSLCLKSGDAVLMKGGSEAANTNRILADIISQASVEAGIPKGWLNLLEARSDVAEMLGMDEHIDLIVPRGSNEFVQHIMQNTNIPVLGHADGICHVYVDSQAEIDMAVKVTVDSKVQYVAVCNAVETLLVHQSIAKAFLPKAKEALEAKGIELRGCARTAKMIDVKAATEDDWSTEYLDLILSVKVVDSLNEAIDHINQYGSGHTDVIVTDDRSRAIKFMDYVNSAGVFMNCSSRFSDGFRYGLGAEVGISTNKIHARGPVGLEGLVIYKWRLMGSGQTVTEYSGDGGKTFTHRKLQKDFE